MLPAPAERARRRGAQVGDTRSASPSPSSLRLSPPAALRCPPPPPGPAEGEQGAGPRGAPRGRRPRPGFGVRGGTDPFGPRCTASPWESGAGRSRGWGRGRIRVRGGPRAGAMLAAAPQLAAKGSSRCGAVGEGAGTRGSRLPVPRRFPPSLALLSALLSFLFVCLFVLFSLLLSPLFARYSVVFPGSDALFRSALRAAFLPCPCHGEAPLPVPEAAPRPRVGKNRREKDPILISSLATRRKKGENGRLTGPGLSRWARTRVASPTRGLGKETSLEAHGDQERAVHASPRPRAGFRLPTERVPGSDGLPGTPSSARQ
ncbi:uncharacterized protein LOC110396126 [Numida meleagris]|uniref:uncharacterized protein LOC110396126 n=1 Tax=Numida meleagris TaxID=8996 RepID=UPI000B3DDBBE|nr:uncharacterized protein LOC110396126 [Numida meleagris]XP_021247168.1 uncharacterized protein LOC110396126 [Numida meleagris]XP_021247169.1 uncharacterized protein LOC110396126 [Numida meleagris]